MINVFNSDFIDRWNTKGELRIGWASWDGGDHQSGSVKWAYKDISGKISRGAPEVPIDVLTAMVKMVLQHETFFPVGDKEAIEDLKRVLQIG